MKLHDGVHALEKGDESIPADFARVKDARLLIWGVGFKRYQDLAQFPNLVDLEVFDYPLATLAPLAAITSLRRLRVVHLPKVTSLVPLSDLSRLEELRLETLPSWDASGKSLVVDSFEPLASLKKLKCLVLTGIKSKDGDLAPLGELKGLTEFVIANDFPQEQLARLAGRLPNVTNECFLRPFLKLAGIKCPKCSATKLMLSGADIRPRVVCPVCKKKHFDKHVARFEELRETSAASGVA